MRRLAFVPTAVAAAVVLSACSSAAHPPAAHPAATVTVTASPVPKASASASPSPLLTIRQARTVYTGLADPYNRVYGLIGSDQNDNVPFGQFHADMGRVLSALQSFAHGLRVTRWPASVQPYVTALLSTGIAAEEKCYGLVFRTRNWTAARTVGQTAESCQEVAGSTQTDGANQIRSLLGLPPLG